MDLTPFLRFYSKQRVSKLSSYAYSTIQENQLRSLLLKAQDTRFSRQHEFKKISNVADYQKQVPLRKYEDFWKEYWQKDFPNIIDCTWPGKIPYFPVSSGTTSGRTKYIPYTKEMARSNSKAGLDLLIHHIENKPNSRLLSGKSFVLGGSTELVKEAPGVYSGDLSGISVITLPWWAKPLYFPSAKLALIKDWEEKIDILAKESLKQNITMLSGVPSWLLILLKKLFELKPHAEHKIKEIFPNLEMLVHGGVNFAPYYDQFNNLLKESKAELREVYPASEGFIGVADRSYGDGLRLILDHGIFYEFVPVEELDTSNPTRHWVANIEKDVTYAIVLTTCAGLWSYVLGDTVKFVDLSPPRLLVCGRTSYYLSAFGEHLTGEEVEKAISSSAHQIKRQVSDYSVGALYPEKAGDLGGHLFVVEFSEAAIDDNYKTNFEESLVKLLCELNEDYEAHLANGFGLMPPKVLVVKPGSFAAWMKKRGKLGGQHKVPRIITDRDLFNDLREFMLRRL